jgi:membrane-bound serine protease (ClpP class)
LRRLAIVVLGVGLAVGAATVPAPADGSTSSPNVAPVDVVEVTGLLDPIVVDFIDRSIASAEQQGDQALVLQMNTAGATVSNARMAALASRIASAKIPVTIWVGPSGAKVLGTPAQLLAAAAVTGMAPNTHIGKLGDPLVVPGVDVSFKGNATALRSTTYNATEARKKGVLKLGVNDEGTPTLGFFLTVLDGVKYHGTTLHTAEVTQVNGKPTRKPIGVTRFNKLGLLPRLMHTVASPPSAYLLVTIGLVLVLFEFFTAGVGVAGLVGAGALALGGFGIAALPARWWAVALIGLAMLAFAVDVQTGVPRFYTGLGTFLFTLGSLTLYEGLNLSWIALLAGIGGVLLVMLVGMPSMVRTRFATPTIGRGWMIGELGDAVTDIDPDGIVLIRDAKWRARTNRATPIKSGGRLRVVALEGTVLEVEPEAGGARDHRERRHQTDSSG